MRPNIFAVLMIGCFSVIGSASGEDLDPPIITNILKFPLNSIVMEGGLVYLAHQNSEKSFQQNCVDLTHLKDFNTSISNDDDLKKLEKLQLRWQFVPDASEGGFSTAGSIYFSRKNDVVHVNRVYFTSTKDEFIKVIEYSESIDPKIWKKIEDWKKHRKLESDNEGGKK